MVLYLKKQANLVSVEETMKEELDKLDTVGPPKIFNKVLLGMNISFSPSSVCPIFNHDSDLSMLCSYATQPSIERLHKIVQHYQLKSDTKSTILRALDPPALRVYHQETELQLTTTHLCSLFELAILSNNIYVNSNKQIPDLLNNSILPHELKESLTEFHVDAILVQQFDHTHFLKIVREDKQDKFENHYSHPDFVRVIFIMRLAFSRNVRELVKRDLNLTIHNNLFVLGMTTDREVTNLYCMKANIDENLTINYSLYFIGSYRHNQIRDRAKLVDYIFQAFSLPDPLVVEDYLTVEKLLDTTIIITQDLIFSYTEKSNEMKSDTTKSLWKGKLYNKSLSKTWDVYCKKTESSDYIISTLPFLTLYACSLPTSEILTLAGESVRKLLDKNEITQFVIDLLIQLGFLFHAHCIHEKKAHGIVSPKSDIYSLGFYIKELVDNYESYEWLKEIVESMQKPVNERTVVIDCIKFLKDKQNEFTPIIKETYEYFKKKNHFLDEINHIQVQQSFWDKMCYDY